VALAQRQKPLAGGHKARGGLMKEGEHRALFSQPERAAREAKSYAVMNEARRFPRAPQSLLEKRKITDGTNRREKIPAQRSTAGAAFSGWFSSAEIIIDFKPAADIELTAERFRELRSRPAKHRFEQSRFLDVTVQESGEFGGAEQVRGNERFQSERMRERANWQGAVGQM